MTGVTRRGFLATTAAATGALAGGTGRAVASPAKFDGEIRVLGIGGYDLVDQIRKRAQKELGFRVVFREEFPSEINRLVGQQPASFDVFSCFQQDTAEFWATGSLQPVEIARIRHWPDVNPLYKLGRVQPGSSCGYGQGDAAFRRLYVDPDRSVRWPGAPGVPSGVRKLLVQWVDESTGRTIGPEPKFCTGAPALFNFDSFGYNARVLGKRPDQLSWAELLNSRWKGRVGLNSEPEVGLQDTANAVQAKGLMRFGDLGNPTRKEIDRLVKILLAYRKRGQFFGIWTKGTEPFDWMPHNQVVLCTLFAAQIAVLATLGLPIHQADPREGYRAFAGFHSISSEVRDPAKLEACYAFINWWQSGFAGAFFMREGYFSAVQKTTRPFTAPGEYAYWIEGKPADRTYPGPFGDKEVAKGDVRDGGSLPRRACRISSWNSRPTQRPYFLERWNEFISRF